MVRMPQITSLVSSERMHTALIVAAILTTGLATVTTNCADPDLWGHVQYGREVLRDGVLPATATWTYAAEGATWINHENIAEFLLAGTVDMFGAVGLPWMKLGLATLIFALMIYSSRRSGAGWPSIWILVAVVAANLQFHWHFRPQILTYSCLAVMLTIWQHVFDSDGLVRETGHSFRGMWLLPPLLCFWANSHGGFAAGLAILGVVHAMVCLETIRRDGQNSRTKMMQITLVTAASFLATLVNPYGIGLWKFMLEALKLPRPEIADWGPLDLWSSDAANFWLLMMFVAICVIMDRRHLVLWQIVIISLLLWQGVSHCRHLSIVSIVCGFWMPRHLHAAIEVVRAKLVSLQQAGVARQPGLAGRCVLLGVVVLNAARLAPKLTEVPVECSEYPVAAMQFLHDRGLHGNVLVTFNWAQYAIGCFSEEPDPQKQSRVAVDGRFETCYPREITDVCFDFWLGEPDPERRYRSPLAPPYDPARALELNHPDLVLLSREQGPSVRVMQRQTAEWVLLYQDSLSQVWGRRSRYDDARDKDYLAESLRHISDDIQHGTLPWPAFPSNHAAASRVAIHDEH